MADAAGDGRRAVNPPSAGALTWPLFQPHERAKLSAAVMLVGLLAPACSPAIGGLLVEAFSWRWVFFASLPVALLTFVLAVRWLNDTPGPVRPTRFLPLSLLADPAALRDADLPLRAGDVYWRQRGGDVLPATRHRDGAGGNRCPDGAPGRWPRLPPSPLPADISTASGPGRWSSSAACFRRWGSCCC